MSHDFLAVLTAEWAIKEGISSMQDRTAVDLVGLKSEVCLDAAWVSGTSGGPWPGLKRKHPGGRESKQLNV